MGGLMKMANWKNENEAREEIKSLVAEFYLSLIHI